MVPPPADPGSGLVGGGQPWGGGDLGLNWRPTLGGSKLRKGVYLFVEVLAKGRL